MKLELDRLPDSITSIGNSAFMQCPHLRLSALPRELIALNDYVFANSYSINIKYLGGPLSKGNKLTSIGHNSLYGTGSNIDKNTIWIGESVTSIARSAFNNAYAGEKVAYFWHSPSTYGVEVYSELGLHNGISTSQWQPEDDEQWGEG